MPHPVELSTDAADEVINAKLWYEQRDQKVSLAFAREIDAAIEIIASDPLPWPVTRKNIRRFVLREFPFSIVYMFEDQTVRIIAIAHARRRPGYWKDRLSER